MSELRDFSDRTAVVTGGSRGIGKAIGAAFAHRGANVVLVSRRQDALDAAAAEIEASGQTASVRALAVNVEDEDGVREALAGVAADLGPIDVLVNNAATNPYYGDLLGLDLARAEKTVRVNQYAPILWTRVAVEHGLAERAGSVVNITSVGAMTVDRGIGWYNATKAAVTHITQQLAIELAPRVRVNAVAPGLVRTEMSQALWEGREEFLSEVIPMSRIGEPEDISAAVLFLASKGADWITGQTLVVDGGARIAPLVEANPDGPEL
jgi:NAD(P)-dependent dehydrogenase (short-subunit alcohol dehydrogenase family)